MKNFNKLYKKKLISLILALVIVLTALPINALAVADPSLELPPDSENQEVTEMTLEIPEDIPEDAGNEPPPENEIPDEPPTIEPKFIIPKASVKFVGFEDYPIDGIFAAVKIALKANDVPIDIGEIAINQTEIVFNEKPEAEGDVPITYTFALDSNTNADVTVEIVGSEITIIYVNPVVEEELPTEGEVTPPEGEEIEAPAPEVSEEELRNRMGDNPDNLDGPIYVEGSGLNYLPGSLSTASMGTRFLAEKSPTIPGGVELIKTVEEIDGLLNTFKVTLRVEALDEQKSNDIVLVIDTSGSMAGARLANTKVAADQFVDELLNESHPLTRIALVSFAGGAVERKGFVNYTGKEDLKNAINALSATGGTHTQAGIHMARTLLNGSPADIKQIVLLSDGEPTYSYGMTNPDNYLEPRPGGGQRTNTLSPKTNYQYNNTEGNGSTIETQYNWRQNRYYHHGNSAIAEAGFAKTAGYTVHTIAMGAGPTGTQILNSIASPGKAYSTTDPTALSGIFATIAADIMAAMRNASVNDPMGTGFQVTGGYVTNLEPTQGTATYDQADKRISWTIGDLTTPTPNPDDDPNLKYAELVYHVEINDDILNTVSVDGNYKTNAGASVTYTDVDGNVVTSNFPEPTAKPLIIEMKKVLLDAGGNVVPDTFSNPRLFNFNVTLDGEADYNKNYPTGGNKGRVMTDIRTDGTYTLTEDQITGTPNSNFTDYETKVNWETYDKTQRGTEVVGTTYAGFKVPRGGANEPLNTRFTFTNQEKALGKLTINKIVNNMPVADRSAKRAPAPEFTVTVVGTNIYNPAEEIYNETHTLTTATPIVLEKLQYGEYTVTETVTNGFTPSYNDSQGVTTDGKVKLSIDSKEHTVTVTNTPDPDTAYVDVDAKKIWIDGPEADHVAVQIALYQDGEIYTATPTVTPATGTANEFNYKWTGLPKYNKSGAEAEYTVKEVNVHPYYNVTQVGNTITNTFDEELAPFTVNAYKDWSGGGTTKPDVWFTLYRKVGATGTEEIVTVDNDNVTVPSTKQVVNNTVSWDNMPRYEGTDNTQTYIYFVKETDAGGADFTPLNYTKSENGLRVLNTYNSPLIDVEGKKVWVGGVAEKPTIWLSLYRKVGTGTGEAVVVAGNPLRVELTSGNLSHTWNDLPKTDVNGADYTYYVLETDADGADWKPDNYSKVESGLTVTNYYESPANGELEVTKIWEGDDRVTRPKMEFTLWRTLNVSDEGAAVASTDKRIVDVDNNTAKWKDLVEYNEDGVKYIYYVKEAFVEDKITNDNWVLGKYNFDDNSITNRVVKNYDDDTPDEKLGKLDIEKVFLNEPQAAKGIQLMAATPIEFTVVVTDEYGIETSVQIKAGETKNLTELYYGEYTIKETVTHGYTPSYAPAKVTVKKDATTPAKFVVTNKNTGGTDTDPTVKDVTVNKEWVNGPKPGATLELWRKGVEVDGTAIDEKVGDSFNATATDLSKTYEKLAKHDPSGREFEYYAKEPIVPTNYTSAYKKVGDEEDKLTIINTFVVPTDGTLTFTKVWEGDNQVTRPTMVIELWRKVGTVEEAVVGADKKEVDATTTTATWTGLEKTNAAGDAYTFFVKETFKVEKESNNNWILGEYDFTNNSITNRVVKNYDDDTPDEKLGKLDIEKIFINEPQAAKGVQLMAATPIEFTVVVTDEYGIETSVQIKAGETKNLTELYYGEYTIEETVTHGYTPSYAPEKVTVKKDAEEVPKFVVTNTNKDDSTTDPTTVNITITKEWVNGPKPDTVIELWRKGVDLEGNAIDEAVVNASFTANATKLSETFYDLAKHDPSGREFEYYAKEPTTPANYEQAYRSIPGVEGAEATLDLLTIVNTYNAPDTITITGRKIWDDGYGLNANRPTIWLKLNRRVAGGALESVPGTIKKLSGAGNHSATWTVPARDSLNREYIYTVQEVDANGRDYKPYGYTKTESGLTVTNRLDVPDIWPPALNKEDHFAYVIGYPDGEFKPERTITRAEMTAIFARLLAERIFLNENYVIPFTDVSASAWYAEYVGMLTSVRVISGYPDGTFKPENPVTRAEFATVAARFIGTKKSIGGFPDVSNEYWARESIETVLAEGWITGYPDGTFRPESPISRAEVVNIVNKMLDRYADKDYVELHKTELYDYTDLTNAHWAYYQIMEASNGHYYTRLAQKAERWDRHWTPYEQEQYARRWKNE